MRDPVKVKKEMEEKDQIILEAAFQIFVEKKIEAVSMDEIARAANVGRATLFRHYASKPELVIAVNTKQWGDYLSAVDAVRPISSIHEIPAIDRLIFTMDSYIDMYQKRKDLLQFNDNFNHYVSHAGRNHEKLQGFHNSLYSADTRFRLMFEKAKEDHTFRTDIPREQFFRVTVHTMMTACAYYAGGFIWGSEENRDYTDELVLLKDMILGYATAGNCKKKYHKESAGK